MLFLFLFFFFFPSSALFPRVDHSRIEKRDRSDHPFPSSSFFSEVQRDTSCARLAARDYHTICISSLHYYFPVIPANSRPLDRDREREKQEEEEKRKRNVKFSLSRPRSSSNTFRTRVSQILLYRTRRYICICIYIYVSI